MLPIDVSKTTEWVENSIDPNYTPYSVHLDLSIPEEQNRTQLY